MATEQRVRSVTLPVAMATVIRQWRFVNIDGNGQIVEATGNSTNIAGIARSASTATSDLAVSVTLLDGAIAKVTAGAAINAGVNVKPDSQGRATTAASSDDRILGTALEAATRAGQVIAIKTLAPGRR